MKRYGYRLFILVVLLFSVGLISDEAQAKTKKDTLMVLNEVSNVAVSIQYDAEEPSIYFVAPDGSKYTSGNARKKGMRIEKGDKNICYYISDAMAGTWQIVYDKKNSSKLDITFSDFVDPLRITSLKFEKQGEEYLKVKFECSYTKNESYKYNIYAVVQGGGSDGSRLLYSGNAMTNDKQEVETNLSALNTYASYYIRLEVYMNVHGIETGDEKTSDKSFSYTQKNSPKAMENCRFCVDILRQQLEIDWSESGISAEKVIVAVFGDEESEEPLSSQTLESGSTSAILQIDTEQQKLTAHVAYQNAGMTSEVLKVDIPLQSNPYRFSFDTEEVTNARQLQVSYQVPQSTEVTVSINGEEKKKTVEGQNSFSIVLPDEQNDCYLSFSINENVTYILHREITIDSIAPIFTLYEKYSDITTYDSVINIVGDTEKDTVLTINGQEYPLDEDGYFSVDLDLQHGENTFEIKVCDSAGNISQQSVTITRAVRSSIFQKLNYNGLSKWIPMLVTFGGTLISALLLILFYDWRMSKIPEFPKRNLRYFHCVLTGVMLLVSLSGEVFVIMKGIRYWKLLYTKAYYDLVKESVQKAYDTYRYFQICVIACIVLLVVSVLLVLLLKFHIGKLKKHLDVENREGKKVKCQRKRKEVYCPYCGSAIKADEKFCGACGKRQ